MRYMYIAYELKHCVFLLSVLIDVNIIDIIEAPAPAIETY